MPGPSVHPLLEIADVVDHVRALGVSLGIAGPGHAEVPPAVDEGNQLVGMEEVRLGREIGIPVAPQGQHVLHPVPLQAGQQLAASPRVQATHVRCAMAVMWYWFWMMEAISWVDWFTALDPPAP